MDPKSGRIYRTPEEIEAAQARGEDLIEITEEQAAIAEEIGEMGNREERRKPERQTGALRGGEPFNGREYARKTVRRCMEKRSRAINCRRV